MGGLGIHCGDRRNRREKKSKLDKDLAKLAKEAGVKVGCVGGELEDWPIPGAV
jgi:hypothetical protein